MGAVLIIGSITFFSSNLSYKTPAMNHEMVAATQHALRKQSTQGSDCSLTVAVSTGVSTGQSVQMTPSRQWPAHVHLGVTLLHLHDVGHGDPSTTLAIYLSLHSFSQSIHPPVLQTWENGRNRG